MGLFSKKQNNNYEYVSSDSPDGHIPMIIDSMKLIETTTNPDTYFYRYKLAKNEACFASSLPNVIYGGMTARQIYQKLGDREQKDLLHMEFIDRLFSKGVEDRLTYLLYEVGGYMSQDVRDYFVERLDGKKYHFCKVKFDSYSNKSYTYITKDKSVKIGDTVTIPTGNQFEPESKVVQVCDTFEASLEDIGFPIDKLRCVERKLKSIVCPHCGASIEVDTGKKLGKCTRCQSEFYFI